MFIILIFAFRKSYLHFRRLAGTYRSMPRCMSCAENPKRVSKLDSHHPPMSKARGSCYKVHDEKPHGTLASL